MEQSQAITPVPPAPTAYKRGATLDTTMFYMGSLMSFLVKSEDTGGRFALMEAVSKPGNEPPPHLHQWEHETYYLLEGTIEFYLADKVLTATAGEAVFIPQGVPHAISLRSPRVRTLVMAQATGEQPVGIDRYFIAMAEPATRMDLPADAITYVMDDSARAVSLAAGFGGYFLSPEETAQLLPHYTGFGNSQS